MRTIVQNPMFQTLKTILVLTLFALPGCGTPSLPPSQSAAPVEPEFSWPREVPTSHGTLIIYQPQIEGFEADTLSGRSAISITLKGENELVFGTIWMVSEVDIDRDKRIAYPKNIRVPRVHFTDSTPAQEAKLATIVEEAASK